MTYWIRVNGLPLSDDVVTTSPQWETLADGGCGQGGFTVRDSLLDAGRQLVPGALVEIVRGLMPVYSGEVIDYDPDSGEVACAGLAAGAENFTALDPFGNTTRNTATAVDAAALRGWRIVNRAGVFGVVSGDETSPQSLASLLTAFAEQTAQRWGVSGTSRLFMRADPTIPQWFIAPGAVALGGSLEGAVSHYVVEYDTGSGLSTVISAHPKAHLMPRREETLDLKDRGALGIMEVSALLGGIHALTPAGLAWSTGATVNSSQITTVGDTPADLASVRAGQMVRIFASPTASAIMPAMWVDAVIGKTSYTAGEGVIAIEPSNKAPRGFRDVLAS